VTHTEAGMGEGEAALLLAGEDLLSRDNIPDENQRLECFSCDTPYVGVFCHACGQKNDDMRRSLFSLILDLLGNITAFDSRIWRTWAKLLTRPGKVAREYADGSRTKWTSPVRAYLAMSILLFGYIALTGTQILSLTMDVEREEGAPEALSELKPSQLNADFQLLMFETNRSLENRREASNSELVAFLLNYDEPLAFDYVNGSFKLVEEGYERPKDAPARRNVNINTEDLDKAEDFFEDLFDQTDSETETPSASDPSTPDEITDTNDGGYVIINGKRMTPQEASSRGVASLKLLLSRPEIFNNYFSTYLPRVMFFMMPFAMFIGIVFIRGRGNALLYDHLVHTAYIHAVFFFLLFVGLVLGQYTPIPPSWLLGLLTLYMLLYLPMSLSGMFKRGPVKTIWSSYAIGFIYFITMTVIITTLTIMAFINVMDQAQLGSFSYG